MRRLRSKVHLGLERKLFWNFKNGRRGRQHAGAELFWGLRISKLPANVLPLHAVFRGCVLKSEREKKKRLDPPERIGVRVFAKR